MVEKYDVVVIGGGSGGLTAAAGAAKFGLKTLLVEKSRLGGDCLWYGCVPSKALLRSAHVANLARRSRLFGLTVNKLSSSIPKVMGYVHEVQSVIERHDSPKRFEKMGVDVVFGNVSFTSKKVVKVGHRFIKSKHFVIATGSRPFIPPIDGLEEAGYLTNETVFSLDRNIKSLVVIGGGPVGCEMAQAFSRLGVEVTLVERNSLILPREDEQASRAVMDRFGEEGIRVITEASVTEVKKLKKGKQVTYEQGGRGDELVAEEVLIAVGRKPNVEGLNLKLAGVKVDKGILVDRRMRTSQKHIFAVGDVCSKYRFTHVAEAQAGVALANIAFKWPRKFSGPVPWATFTDPAVARVGKLEKDVPKARVFSIAMSEVDRALCDSETDGFVKLVVRKGKILGVTVVGERAGEYFHEFVLAMQNGLSLRAISETIHVYPTLARAVRKAANEYYAEKLFSKWSKRLVRLLRWL